AVVSEVLAKGLEPEDAFPEEAEWAELPIPEELRDLAERLILSAEAPELWKIVTKTVKTEKKVTHKAALPFLPPKIETVTVQEKLETRERVWPDPAVLKTGMAKKGERVGLLSSARAGKMGKDIFGKPIPSGGDSSTFVLGRGISRNKNELVADEDGILRAGRLWVEVIPLASHRFEVRLSSDGTTFVLDYQPGHEGLPLPDAAMILAKAMELGAGEADLVDSHEVAAALREAMLAGRPLESFPLSTDRDASVSVDIASDGSLATLNMRKGRGRGKAFELAAVTAALKASGLRGFKMDEVKKAVLEFYKGETSDFPGLILLEGKAPTRGKDRSLGLSIAPLPKDKMEGLQARIAEHAEFGPLVSDPVFPLGEATIMAFVKDGQRIGELTPPSPGQPGLDIRGNPVPGLPGNDPVIHCLDGIVFAKGRVSASLDGLLVSAEKEGSWYFRVLPCVDALVRVEVAIDGMEGYVSLRAERGIGSPLEVESVIKAVAERGIVFGVDPRRIAEAVADARAGRPVERRVIARGRLPLQEGSPRIEWKVQGGAPADESCAGAGVKAAGEILRISGGATEAVEGCDILGKPRRIPAGEGAPGDLIPEHDETIEERVLPEGGRSLVARVAGELCTVDGRLSVRNLLVLEGDLTAKDGEKRFSGSIEVGGVVRSGARLFAGGDIKVFGSVEDALVSSEGILSIGGVVKGARKAMLRAVRGMRLSSAEQALLLAVEDILVNENCLLCNVKTNGKLSVAGGRGSLVGGLVKARRGIEVDSLGSERGLKTEIAFGQDYLVGDMIETEQREIEKVKSAILQSDRMMRELERAGAGLDRIRQDKVKLLKLLEKRSARIFDFREKFEQHFPSEVRVRGTVWPGVILESHGRFFEVRSRKTAVVFSFDPSNGRIVERPLA
ncbi:MAG TPA: FapA family protein, partial [Rectinemataceae bacterium]|nr:FapA family protein [Rectinemataceae bacterium]